MLREVSSPTGLFSYLSQCSFIDVARIAVADADGINQSVCLLRPFYGLVHFHVTTCVFTICKQDDGAPRVFSRSAEKFFRRGPHGIPDCGRPSQTLIGARNRRSTVYNNSSAYVARGRNKLHSIYSSSKPLQTSGESLFKSCITRE